MILDLDIGNTMTKWRLKSSESSCILERGFLWTRDRWRNAEDIPDLRDIRMVRVSNVAGQEVLGDVERLCRRFRVPMHLARSTLQFAGVRNGYLQPDKLGVDRWLGVLAGYHHRGACCVVDCGSAVTIDVVTAEGQHQGGFIAPGVRLMKESLKLGTREVPVETDQESRDLAICGVSTQEAVSRGISQAVTGMINQCYRQSCLRLGCELPLLLTGGDGAMIAHGLDADVEQWPDMVYAGLELMFPVTEAEKQGELYGAPEKY